MSWTPAPFTRLVTGHDPKPSSDEKFPNEPSTVYHSSSGQGEWQQMLPSISFSLVYSSDARPNLNGDADVAKHEDIFRSGTLGLVNPAGSVCRMVDWAPRDPNAPPEEFMHRTISLDYGIVVKGEVELSLPDEEPRILKQGDVCVQRATMHSWRNASTEESARMVFVLLATDPLQVGDKTLGEALPDPPESIESTTAELLQAKKA